MSLEETIRTILADTAAAKQPQDLAERLIEADRLVAHHIKVACEWIDHDLISEPIAYSESLGNLVELAGTVDRARSKFESTGTLLPPSTIDLELADQLNAHYIKGSDVEPLLGRLRENCFLKTGPMEMMLCLRAIRRAFPRERRFHDEINDMEEVLATWIDSGDRNRDELADFIDFMSSYQPRTSRLRTVHEAVVDRRNRALAARVEKETLELLDRMAREEKPSSRSIKEALARISRLRSASVKEIDPRIRELETRLLEIAREEEDRKAREIRARTAIAALERALDEKSGIRETENLYASARREAGSLEPDLEARARRRLEIEKSVRVRRVASVVVAVVALSVITGWWLLNEDRKESRRRILDDVVLASENAMESGDYEKIAGIVAGSSRSAAWLRDEPRVVTILNAARDAIRNRDEALARTCTGMSDIAAEVEAGDLDIASARLEITRFADEAPDSITEMAVACREESMDRVNRAAIRLTEAEEALMESELQAAEADRLRITAPWRDAGARLLLSTTAYENIESGLGELKSRIEERAADSPELTGLQPMRQRYQRLAEKILDDLDRLRQQRNRLAAGLDAVRRTFEPSRTESEFANRIRQVIAEHPATLEDIGRFSTFESTSRTATALVPLQAWRDRFSTLVLDAIDPEATTSVRTAGLGAADEFLAEHPGSMIDEEVTLVRDRLDLELRGDESLAVKIADDLRSLGLHNLRRVETMNGWVYARPSEDGRRWHYLSTIGDLAEPANALPFRPPVEIIPGARPVRSKSSLALEDGITRLRNASGFASSRILLEIIQEVRSSNDLDPLLNLTIQDLLWQAWRKNHRDLDPEGSKLVSKWLDRLRDEEREVILTDWVTTARRRRADPGRERDARILTRSSPDPDLIATRIDRRGREIAAALEPVLPVGIVLPSPDPTSPRSVRWLDDVSYESDLVVPVQSGSSVSLKPAILDSMGRVIPAPDLPREAILIFRTARPRNQP